ncbi:MAG: metabolite traffic protein EboE [Gammaproteobacteria bacterium]|nr:metabolite traffic protein EboE [Gammaproteobacteria bacterium]
MIGSRTPGWSRAELSYCSNVHPGDSLEAVQGVISQHLVAVRRQRELEYMASGLWLSANAARALCASESRLHRFAQGLDEQGIRLVTLNGFPYGQFHGEQVKTGVYRPDWSEPERLTYTLDLARILAHCLPREQRTGSISTLPLGYAPGWDTDRHHRALSALCDLAVALADLQDRCGRHIRVCLEMEPGCRLESTVQAITLFAQELPEVAARRGVPKEFIERYLGLCYDVCHQAVMFENASDALTEITRAGIPVGKIQISSALELANPDQQSGRERLGAFAEPRYLHQVRTRDQRRLLQGTMDLPEALADRTLPRHSPWRIHFHLPIQTALLADGELGTTQTAILDVLDHLSENPGMHPHLEVETYTWQVLPLSLRPSNDDGLHQGLGNELRWLEVEMDRRGLLRETTP